MRQWPEWMMIGRVMHHWTQYDLAERCAAHNDETAATWRQVIMHVENGRVIPAGEHARILEEVLGETVPNLGAYVPNLGTEKEE